jgi:pimeloyl-ACP methyl ester carboxylesterase
MSTAPVESSRPHLVFVCGHLCDERLFAAQVAALSATHECSVLVFRHEDTLAAMAESLLQSAPPRFTLVGLSMGGYVAFEVIRRAPERLRGLVLLDTTAAADTPARRAGRLADLDKANAVGMAAFAPSLLERWLLPAHARIPELADRVCAMAVDIGVAAQRNQQVAMLARPDSTNDLAGVAVPTLVACGRQDVVTPVADHEAIAARIPGAQLAIIEESGHLCTLEQPAAVTTLLQQWLRERVDEAPRTSPRS